MPRLPAAAAAEIFVFDCPRWLPRALFRRCVLAGTKQVVNGVIYDLQLAVAISPCRNPYTMADPSAAEPKGDPCEKNYRVAETQPMHARVLLRPQEADPYLVTFDQDMF